MTTTVAMASTWPLPRLPRFVRLHPEIDLRVVASTLAQDPSRPLRSVSDLSRHVLLDF